MNIFKKLHKFIKYQKTKYYATHNMDWLINLKTKFNETFGKDEDLNG